MAVCFPPVFTPLSGVVTLASGPGRLTIPVARQVGPHGDVVAMDIQPGMLRRAQEIAQVANLNNIRFLQASAGDGQLVVGRADRALLVTVLGEIPNREAALGELFAALKPDGVLSVTEIIFDPIFRAETQSSVWLARLDSERKRSLGIAWRSP